MKKPALRCALFMALYYGANAVYQGYISKFYQQSGISGSRLILLLVSFPLLSILSQPLWGWASDRMPRRNVALLITVGASIPLLCLLGLMKGYAGTAIVSCLFALFYPCVQPLGDSLILQSLQESPIPYGRVRLAGSVSYALCSLAAGALLGRNYRAMPWMAAGMLALLFGGALLLPPQAGRPHTRIRGGFWQVFRLPHALPLLGLVMLLQAAMGYFYSYFALHFTSLNGGSGALLGWAYLIGSASEIPFLLLGDRLFDRFGAGRLMLVSAAALTLRFGLLALVRSPIAALASQALHGLGFVVMMLCMAKYMSRVAPPALRGSAQAVISMAGYGISRTFGVLAGGFISNRLGSIGAGFGLMAAVCALALIGFAPVFLRLPVLNGKKAKF